MNRINQIIFLALFALCQVQSVIAETAASRIKKDLVGVAMKSEHADAIAKLLATGDIGIINNNSYIKVRDAAGTADISVIKVDANDDTIINSDASDVIKLQLGGDANRLFTFNASSDAAHTITFGDSGTTASQTLDITASTSDADDDSQIQICAGGACSGTRGAYLLLEGEEEAGAGRMQIVTGASGTFSLTQGGGTALVINGSQAATFYGTLTANRTSDLGWAVVAGANTACNTTCTNACVFGVNTAATEADIVGCSDATADECLCAGAS